MSLTSRTEPPISQAMADLETDSLLGTFPEGQRLVGTSCNACGQVMIGTRVVCSNCVSRDVTRIGLPTGGVLYSFTRIHGRGDDVRAIGYVDLDNQVRTLADLDEGSTPLQPDVRVELVVEGDEWSFAPSASQ